MYDARIHKCKIEQAYKHVSFLFYIQYFQAINKRLSNRIILNRRIISLVDKQSKRKKYSI